MDTRRQGSACRFSQTPQRSSRRWCTESQRDSVSKPRVARHAPPWVMAKEHCPAATRLRRFHSSVRVPAGRNPSRLKAELHTQCVGCAWYGVPASAGPASPRIHSVATPSVGALAYEHYPDCRNEVWIGGLVPRTASTALFEESFGCGARLIFAEQGDRRITVATSSSFSTQIPLAFFGKCWPHLSRSRDTD